MLGVISITQSNMPREKKDPFLFKCPWCGLEEIRGARKRFMTSCGSKECKRKAKSKALKERHENVEESYKMTKHFNGKGNPRWVEIGTIKKDSRGRSKIKIAEGHWQPYHRYLMEQEIGRKLEPDEVVHHINKDKTDDRIENLQLLTDHDHRSLHMKERHNQNT